MHEYAVLLWITAVLLSIAGIAGLLLPAIPGAPLLFLGLLCAAWAENFTHVGLWTLVVLGLLAALTYVVDFFASLLGAKRFGASGMALTGTAVGGLVGIFFGLPGIVLGPFLGAVAGELINMKSLGQAGLVGIGTLIGLAVGTAGKLAIAITMLGVFFIVRFL